MLYDGGPESYPTVTRDPTQFDYLVITFGEGYSLTLDNPTVGEHHDAGGMGVIVKIVEQNSVWRVYINSGTVQISKIVGFTR